MGANGIQSFRDLDAWKVAMDLTVLAYEAAKRLPQSERYQLSSQIRRAAVSVPSNIAEGQSYGSDKRYLHHLRIALGSLGELSTQMELAVRLDFVTFTDVEAMHKQLSRTRQLLFGLLRTIRRRRLAQAAKGATLLTTAFWLLQIAIAG